MSFRWTRQGDFLTSVCGLCGYTTRERDQRAILDHQRAHDPFTCQMQRAQTAWANSLEGQAETRKRAGYDFRDAQRADPEPERTHCSNGHAWTPENLRTTTRGYEVCKVCDRDYQKRKKSDAASCVSRAIATGLGVALGRIDTDEAAPDLTPKPPLSTPNRRNRKECA